VKDILNKYTFQIMFTKYRNNKPYLSLTKKYLPTREQTLTKSKKWNIQNGNMNIWNYKGY